MDILDRLKRARTTACNDDRSEGGSIDWARHLERYDAMIDASAEIERLRSALAALVSDLDARAVEGFVDCSASVWIGANAALAPLAIPEAE
jgi:hypothetical protein